MRRPFRRPHHPRRAGFSLIELLLVMALVGVLLGTGMGLIMGLQPGDRAVFGQVEETVRLVQRTAMAYGTPAKVRIDKENHRIQAQVLRTVGTWHFDSPKLEGGGALDAVWLGPTDPVMVSSGFLGGALDLSGGGAPGQLQISLEEEPAFDWSQGFHLRFAVRMQARRAAPLLQMGDGLVVAVSDRGALGAEFRVQLTGEGGQVGRGSRVRVETDAGLLPLGEWVPVEVIYDRQALSLFVDGIERVRRPEQGPVWMGAPRLWLSSADRPFPGDIDRLVVAVSEELPQQALANGAQFVPDCPEEVAFAPGGALDPLRHTAPVRVAWTLQDGTLEVLRVGLQGSLLQADPGAAPPTVVEEQQP